jgi:hypothetical protein
MEAVAAEAAVAAEQERKKKKKKLVHRAAAGNIVSQADLAACREHSVEVRPLLQVSLVKHRVHSKPFLWAQEVRAFMAHALLGSDPPSSLKLGNRLALSGLVVLALDGVPLVRTAGDSFASSPHSTSAGQLAESFTPDFRASFQLVADLKVFAQAPKSLTEALLYAPAVEELDDTVSNAVKRQKTGGGSSFGKGGNKGKKRPRDSDQKADADAAAAANARALAALQLPPALHYVMKPEQLAKHKYPVLPAAGAAATAAVAVSSPAAGKKGRVGAAAAAAVEVTAETAVAASPAECAAAMAQLLSLQPLTALPSEEAALSAVTAFEVVLPELEGYVITQEHPPAAAAAKARAAAAATNSAAVRASCDDAAAAAVNGSASGSGSSSSSSSNSSSSGSNGEQQQQQHIEPRMFGLDCEMCLTDEGPELCRVTLVDHNHTVLMGKCSSVKYESKV